MWTRAPSTTEVTDPALADLQEVSAEETLGLGSLPGRQGNRSEIQSQPDLTIF
jgi:hypothetical protein